MNLEGIRFIDLTHTIKPGIPAWDMSCGFRLDTISDHDQTTDEVSFKVQKIETACGIGTHMDAPMHCIPNGKSIAELSLQNLISKCIVIDVSTHALEDYIISIDEVLAFERKYGSIAPNYFVIFYTGWERYWNNPKQYINDYCFPTIGRDVAHYLLEKQVVGIGIDTLSPDGPDSQFPVHQILLGAGKYIIENVANAIMLPKTGASIMALPLKVEGATEAPLRLIGLVEK